MFKRLLMGIVAVAALAVFWAEASAQDCVRWRRVGGSNVCAKWTTGSVILETTFQQNCGPDGLGCDARADSIVSNPNIAFCAGPKGKPVEVQCNEDVVFATFDTFTEQCEPKHNKDHDGAPGGGGHDRNHECKATTRFLAPAGSCQASCTAAGLGAVVDVTPIVMHTTVTFFVDEFVGEGPAFAAVAAQSESETPECDAESSVCTVQQQCTIDPKKIDFQKIRPYQCEITDVFSGEIGG